MQAPWQQSATVTWIRWVDGGLNKLFHKLDSMLTTLILKQTGRFNDEKSIIGYFPDVFFCVH